MYISDVQNCYITDVLTFRYVLWMYEAVFRFVIILSNLVIKSRTRF